ncbi:MAG: HepT-like ribonuclease domain-containing protein [Candidatus Saliniplasma sp.]
MPVEATKYLSDNTRVSYPNVPWKDIAGMRDKLIHGYFGVDIDAVWDTVKRDIPELKEEIKRIIDEIEQ